MLYSNSTLLWNSSLRLMMLHSQKKWLKATRKLSSRLSTNCKMALKQKTVPMISWISSKKTLMQLLELWQALNKLWWQKWWEYHQWLNSSEQHGKRVKILRWKKNKRSNLYFPWLSARKLSWDRDMPSKLKLILKFKDLRQDDPWVKLIAHLTRQVVVPLWLRKRKDWTSKLTWKTAIKKQWQSMNISNKS